VLAPPGREWSRSLPRSLQSDGGKTERERRPADIAGQSLFAANAVRGIIPIQSLAGVPVPLDLRTNDLASRFWPA